MEFVPLQKNKLPTKSPSGAPRVSSNHPLTQIQIDDLVNRELTPEDYELLLLLDETVKKKTASTTVVSALRDIPFHSTTKEFTVCMICLNDFEHSTIVTVLKCSHCYHPDCIKTWLSNSSPNCPIDSLPIVAGPSTRVVLTNLEGPLKRKELKIEDLKEYRFLSQLRKVHILSDCIPLNFNIWFTNITKIKIESNQLEKYLSDLEVLIQNHSLVNISWGNLTNYMSNSDSLGSFLERNATKLKTFSSKLINPNFIRWENFLKQLQNLNRDIQTKDSSTAVKLNFYLSTSRISFKKVSTYLKNIKVVKFWINIKDYEKIITDGLEEFIKNHPELESFNLQDYFSKEVLNLILNSPNIKKLGNGFRTNLVFPLNLEHLDLYDDSLEKIASYCKNFTTIPKIKTLSLNNRSNFEMDQAKIMRNLSLFIESLPHLCTLTLYKFPDLECVIEDYEPLIKALSTHTSNYNKTINFHYNYNFPTKFSSLIDGLCKIDSIGTINIYLELIATQLKDNSNSDNNNSLNNELLSILFDKKQNEFINHGYDILSECSRHGNIDALKFFLQFKSILPVSPLVMDKAIEYGQTNVLKYLIEVEKFEPKYTRELIFYHACRSHNSDLVRYIIDNNIEHPKDLEYWSYNSNSNNNKNSINKKNYRNRNLDLPSIVDLFQLDIDLIDLFEKYKYINYDTFDNALGKVDIFSPIDFAKEGRDLRPYFRVLGNVVGAMQSSDVFIVTLKMFTECLEPVTSDQYKVLQKKMLDLFYTETIKKLNSYHLLAVNRYQHQTRYYESDFEAMKFALSPIKFTDPMTAIPSNYSNQISNSFMMKSLLEYSLKSLNIMLLKVLMDILKGTHTQFNISFPSSLGNVGVKPVLDFFYKVITFKSIYTNPHINYLNLICWLISKGIDYDTFQSVEELCQSNWNIKELQEIPVKRGINIDDRLPTMYSVKLPPLPKKILKRPLPGFSKPRGRVPFKNKVSNQDDDGKDVDSSSDNVNNESKTNKNSGGTPDWEMIKKSIVILDRDGKYPIILRDEIKYWEKLGFECDTLKIENSASSSSSSSKKTVTINQLYKASTTRIEELKPEPAYTGPQGTKNKRSILDDSLDPRRKPKVKVQKAHWSKSEKKRLEEACKSISFQDLEFWDKVADIVGTRTSEECYDQYQSKFLTPKKSSTNKKPKKELSPLSLEKSTKTVKQKTKIRNIIDKKIHSKDNQKDIFDSTPFKNQKNNFVGADFDDDDEIDNYFGEDEEEDSSSNISPAPTTTITTITTNTGEENEKFKNFDREYYDGYVNKLNKSSTIGTKKTRNIKSNNNKKTKDDNQESTTGKNNNDFIIDITKKNSKSLSKGFYDRDEIKKTSDIIGRITDNVKKRQERYENNEAGEVQDYYFSDNEDEDESVFS
eukprot:gene5411-6750_t